MNTQTAKAIPDKLFFKIGEVCDLVGVQAHVLRYWESEFPTLQPQKNRAGQRTYRRKDVEMALRIKELLYDEGFTIAGAKRKLAGEGRGSARLKIVPPNSTVPPSSDTNAPNAEDDFTAQNPVESAPPAEPPPPRVSTRETIGHLRLLLEEMLATLNRDVVS
jgi:DNA-binding transcriptional MerR regulator